MSVATFSKELKVFNIDDSFSLSASTTICQEVPMFGRITWSGDGKWITVAPVKSCHPLPIYSISKNEILNSKSVSISNITSASFFNWTNRVMAIGTNSGEVYVWDLKGRKIAQNVKTEQGHSVDHICLNSDDACLATASLNTNKICVHSFKTNTVINKFVVPKSECTSSLRFCMCRKTYLAASSFERTICVWDIVKSDVVYKVYNSHVGACSDISFSPINYSVLASVSLTKTLKMFDLREKSSIFAVNLGEPLQCIEMISSGDKVVMGTTSGSVIFYDLRASQVYRNLKAHDGPVLSVKMEVKKPPESFVEVLMDSPDVVEPQSKTLDLSIMDIFSPIHSNHAEKTSGSSKSVTFHSTPKIITGDSELGTECDSFFSKMLSPKSEKVLISTPLEEPASPASSPASSAEINNATFNASKMEPVKEEPVDIRENIPVSDVCDASSGDNAQMIKMASNDSIQGLIAEMRMIHKEQQASLDHLANEISGMQKELSVMKYDYETRYKTLQENYENVIDVLINCIKPEMFAGNCDSKLEHICQRMLINNVNNLVMEKSDAILNEINTYFKRIELMLKKLGGIQK